MIKAISNKIFYYYSKLQKQPKPFKFLVSRFLYKSRLCSLFLISRKNFKIRFFPTNVSLIYWCKPDSFKKDEHIFELCLNKGDTVVDVGANIGGLSLAASSIVGPDGQVYSIEAHPRTYKYLVKNINLNHFTNIHPFNYAISDHNGYINFTSKIADDMNKVSIDGDIIVPTITLDHLFNKRENNIKLLKIDVEGFEKYVILGAQNILKNVQYIYFESKDVNFQKYGYSTSDIIKLLKSLGFYILKLKEGKFIEISEHYVSSKLENLLAVKSIKKSQILIKLFNEA